MEISRIGPRTKKQTIDCDIKVSSINEGSGFLLPGGKEFTLVIDYPWATKTKHHFKTHKEQGMKLPKLLKYIKTCFNERQDNHNVFFDVAPIDSIDNIVIQEIKIDHKKNVITLDARSLDE